MLFAAINLQTFNYNNSIKKFDLSPVMVDDFNNDNNITRQLANTIFLFII